MDRSISCAIVVSHWVEQLVVIDVSTLTTEKVTLQAIDKLVSRRDEYVIIHDEMEAVAGGKVTLLGTEKVYAAYDGIIPLMMCYALARRKAIALR